MDNKTNITLKVDGMTCSACEMRIEQKVGSLPGVKSVTAKYAGGWVKVCYDGTVLSQKAIIDAIESLDYPVISEVEKEWRAACQKNGVLSFGTWLHRFGYLSHFRYLGAEFHP